MTDKAIISSSILTGIGDAIRDREATQQLEGATALISTSDMAARIKAMPVKTGLNRSFYSHTDPATGKWARPAEWDDIESIDISDKHECYLLCDCRSSTDAFVSVVVGCGSGTYWSWGHVADGTFVKSDLSTRTAISNGGYIRLALNTIEDNYIVIKIESSSYLSYVKTGGWSADANINYAQSANYNAVVMRYGRLYRGNNLSFNSYYLESDRILDFGQYYWDSTSAVSCNSAYNGNNRLQRCWLENFHPEKLKITSYASMFSACYGLADVKGLEDMSGWVKSYCTSISAMFNACFSLRQKLIVKDWDMSGITTMSSFCNNAPNLIEIVGMETWTQAPLCTTAATMFSYCSNLKGTIDLSGLYLGRGTANFNCSMSNAFRGTISIDTINLNNCDFSKVTGMGSLFQNSGCKHIIWDTNFTGAGVACLTVGSMFASSEGFEEVIIDGWDLSGCSGTNAIGNMFNYAYGTKKAIIRNCTMPTKLTDTSTSACPFYYAQNIEYIDASCIDLSLCANVYMHQQFANNCTRLVEFYPPQHICKAFNLNGSSKLSHDSLVRVIANLDTVTGTTKLNLGTANLAKLTDEEKAVATGKGWTLV